jgi:hypothetical protein
VKGEKGLTVISACILTDHVGDLASIHLIYALRQERPSVLATLEHTPRVHGALERVTLPSEDIVGMSTITAAIVIAHDKRVGVALLPHTIELGCIPQSLVGELRDTDGVRGWAWPGVLEGVPNSVVHVGHVVWGIEGLAIPASVNGAGKRAGRSGRDGEGQPTRGSDELS